MYNHHLNYQQINSLSAQNSLPLVLVDQNGANISVKTEMESVALSQAEAVSSSIKKLEDDLKKQGLKIKKYEDNIKFIKAQTNSLDNAILDLQVTLGKYHSSNGPMVEEGNLLKVETDEETFERILKHKSSAAGIVYQLKTRHGTQASQIPLIKGVLGIVSTLGKVDDDNLNRLLSEYLGTKTMLAVVCKTLDDVKAMECYDREGSVNKTSGIHGLGASIGRTIDGRFTVICLENLRSYVGEFIADDPQRRLDLSKPRLPCGEVPHGFLGFAVNMIHINREHLFYVTTDGHGLRETLFYNLISHMQVYETREDLQQALPCITDGALSLDGGIIRSNGVYPLGRVEEAEVKFLKASPTPGLPANYYAIEDQMKEKKWKYERTLEDLRREQILLEDAKSTFIRKKQELVQFIAQSSKCLQVQNSAPRGRLTPR